MLTKKDRQQLIEDMQQVFTTKDDLKSFATKDDLKKELRPIKRDIRQIKKDVNSTLEYIDQENRNLKKRVEKVENCLDLPHSS